MADLQERQVAISDEQHRGVTTRSVAGASAAGVAVGGPLLVMMGLSFLATGTLFLVSSPLLLIFSPLLLGTALVLLVALVGFGVAAAMAVVGLCAIAWTLRQMGLSGGVAERMVESAGVRLKDLGGDLIAEKVQEDSSEGGGEGSVEVES